MQLAKLIYANSARSVAAWPFFEAFSVQAKQDDAAGLKRWFASLLAIHQPRRMIALDCPWWNVKATRKVADFLAARPGARVFEYGSGASTAWLARRAAEVVSVEHHPEWHAELAGLVSGFDNVSLLHRSIEGDAYANAIGETEGNYDLIVVDGRRRAECLEQALKRLKPGGIVLFDDSGRGRYRKAIEGCGLHEDHHFGRSFCVPYPDHSSILHG